MVLASVVTEGGEVIRDIRRVWASEPSTGVLARSNECCKLDHGGVLVVVVDGDRDMLGWMASWLDGFGWMRVQVEMQCEKMVAKRRIAQRNKQRVENEKVIRNQE